MHQGQGIPPLSKIYLGSKQLFEFIYSLCIMKNQLIFFCNLPISCQTHSGLKLNQNHNIFRNQNCLNSASIISTLLVNKFFTPLFLAQLFEANSLASPKLLHFFLDLNRPIVQFSYYVNLSQSMHVEVLNSFWFQYIILLLQEYF